MRPAKCIGIDLMGGDALPALIIEAVTQAVALLPNTCFILFGAMPPPIPQTARVIFEAVPDVIRMDDNPTTAVRKKPNSSLVQGIHAVQQGKIDAFISCGNTGALITASALYLPHLPISTRPALLAELPSTSGTLSVIDVGGSVSAQASHLVQFALLASQYRFARYGQRRPKVALLNIGIESQKGTQELRDAYNLLSNMPEAPFHFVGNVEGHDVFTSGIDVLVTNGFTGNIFLKTAEGIAAFVLELMEQKLVAQGVKRTLIQELKSALSNEASCGALVAGVDGLVVKCHGNASKRALVSAIVGTNQLIEDELIRK